MISGVNIGLFGQEREENLLDLIKELDRVEGIERYRISSCEPNLLTDEIVDFVAQSRAFVPHFHLPLQSGDDTVLGKMRRRYKSSVYRERVERVMNFMPDAAIGVDVIVGFPTETDERFLNTVNFIADLPVSYLHVFTYSERPDTVAVDDLDKMDGTPVPGTIRSQRNRKLRLLSEKKRASFYSRFLGSQRPVLWEDNEREGLMNGFTDNHIRVEAPFDAERVGRIEQVGLEALTPSGNVRASELDFLSII